jgi:hypothetical protein
MAVGAPDVALFDFRKHARQRSCLLDQLTYVCDLCAAHVVKLQNYRV